MTRRVRNRVFLLIGILLLVGAAVAQVLAERNPGGPPLSSRDSGGTGALALAYWLERLGYPVDRVEGSARFDAVQVLFVLEPLRRFDRAEVQALLDWVRRGGVLVYVPSLVPFSGPTPAPGGGDGLADELDLGVRFGASTAQAGPALPFFTTPPASRFSVRTGRSLELRHDEWMPLIQEGDRIFAATRQLGQGRVYVTTSDALFANQGIADDDNAAFVLNILARHPARAAIAFEESHHTILERPDLANTIRTSAWGWALLYIALTGFLFLLWGGRRFGPAVVAERQPARSAGDYVISFAGLLQKARAASWVQTQYAGLVRRRLARQLGVRADLPGSDLARLLGERQHIDEGTLAGHLAAIEGPLLSQRALLQHVRALEETLRREAKGDRRQAV